MNFTLLVNSSETDRLLVKTRFYLQLGSTRHGDAIYLFAFPLVGIAGYVLNIFSYWTLTSSKFGKKALYEYLRIYCLNSAIICLIMAISFTCDAKHYLNAAHTYTAAIFKCHVKKSLVSFCYLFASSLDIIISLERYKVFSDKLKIFFKFHSPARISFIIIFLDAFLNVQYFFTVEATKLELIMNGTSQQVSYYCTSAKMLKSGSLLALFNEIQNVIKNWLPVFIEIAINVRMIVFYKTKVRKYWSMRWKHSSSSFELLKRVETGTPGVLATEKIGKRERKSTLMIVYMCTCNVIVHLLVFASVLCNSRYGNGEFVSDLILITNLGILAKHASNCFLFYHFNLTFKKKCRMFVSDRLEVFRRYA